MAAVKIHPLYDMIKHGHKPAGSSRWGVVQGMPWEAPCHWAGTRNPKRQVHLMEEGVREGVLTGSASLSSLVWQWINLCGWSLFPGFVHMFQPNNSSCVHQRGIGIMGYAWYNSACAYCGLLPGEYAERLKQFNFPHLQTRNEIGGQKYSIITAFSLLNKKLIS